MSDAINSLPADVRTRIDQHLDAVDHALKARAWTRSQRLAVTNDLEIQIREMLAARDPAPGSATLADVEAILAQLDPPESYGGEGVAVAAPVTATRPTPTPALPTQRKTSRAAIAGLVFALMALVPLVIIMLSIWYSGRNVLERQIRAEQRAWEADSQELQRVSSRWKEGDPQRAQDLRERLQMHDVTIHQLRNALNQMLAVQPQLNQWTYIHWALILGIPLILLLSALVLGIIAITQIRRSAGQLQGMRLAWFEVAFACLGMFALFYALP